MSHTYMYRQGVMLVMSGLGEVSIIVGCICMSDGIEQMTSF